MNLKLNRKYIKENAIAIVCIPYGEGQRLDRLPGFSKVGHCESMCGWDCDVYATEDAPYLVVTTGDRGFGELTPSEFVKEQIDDICSFDGREKKEKAARFAIRLFSSVLSIQRIKTPGLKAYTIAGVPEVLCVVRDKHTAEDLSGANVTHIKKSDAIRMIWENDVHTVTARA